MAAIRTASVMFTDLAGSTELFGGLGRVRAERIRREHIALIRNVVERRGGSELKHLGDGVMATFDSATDSVDCAAAIQQSLAASNARRDAPQLSVRIGLSAGDVTIDGNDCFGPPVVEASRLCGRADGGQVLVTGALRALIHDPRPVVECDPVTLKGLSRPTAVWELHWSESQTRPLRVIVADDVALLRAGVVGVLEGAGMDVVAEVGDGDALLRAIDELRPDVAIVDVRMPPTQTQEGLRASEEIRARWPGTGVILLSQDVESHYALALVLQGLDRIGYLLKQRVAATEDFATAVRRVAAGGNAFDASVVAPLLPERAADGPVADLTPAEMDALSQLAMERLA
jgi:class 3 adenylate cyclase/DNA-binding NarL/FixJ family response regulator